MSISEKLAYCVCTSNLYAHGLMRGFHYTDGIQTLAEEAGAYWLIDVVASHQLKRNVRREPFQLWSIRKLPEDAKNAAVIECRSDTGKPALCRQLIPFTDFPFGDLGETFEWFVEGRTMLLKSEH